MEEELFQVVNLVSPPLGLCWYKRMSQLIISPLPPFPPSLPLLFVFWYEWKRCFALSLSPTLSHPQQFQKGKEEKKRGEKEREGGRGQAGAVKPGLPFGNMR